MDALTLIASVISIISGVAAVISARKAKGYEQGAKEAKEQVFEKQSTISFVHLLDLAKEIDTLLNKYTAPKTVTRRGVNPQKDHERIEHFISCLNENAKLHPNVKICAFIVQQYDWFSLSNQSDPKPYADMKYHVRIIIRELNSIIKT